MLHLPKHRTGEHLVHRTSAKEKGSDNSEVAAPAADRPEQVLIRLSAGGHETAIRQHDVNFQQVIQTQTIFPRQIPGSSAEREPGNSGGGNDTSRDSQSEALSRMVEICLSAACLGPHRLVDRIDSDPFHRRKVNHHAVITDAESSAVVASAANGDRETLLAREIYRCPYVGHIGAADDNVGMTIDHSIVYFASDFIFAAGWGNYASPDGRC